MISLPAIEAVLQAHWPPAEEGAPNLAVEAAGAEGHTEIVLFTTEELSRETVNARIREAGLSALYSIRRVIRIESIPVLGTGKTDYRSLKETLS